MSDQAALMIRGTIKRTGTAADLADIVEGGYMQVS
jgi:hypothetical protein